MAVAATGGTYPLMTLASLVFPSCAALEAVLMLIKLDPTFESMRGRNGNLVLYPVGDRMFGRTFAVPTDPDTPAQQSIKSITTQASQAYNSLTANELDQWRTFAANVPKTDANGDEYKIDAKSGYVMIQTRRLMSGAAIDNTPPPAVAPVAFIDITNIETDGTDINITVSQPTTANGQRALVSITAPLGSLARQPRENDFRVWTLPFTTAFFTRSASAAQTFSNTNADSRFDLSAGDIVGVKIVPLTPGMFPGGAITRQLTVGAA